MDKVGIVTIKFSEEEVETIYQSVSGYVRYREEERASLNVPEVGKEFYTLKADMRRIRKWIIDEKNKRIIDKRISEESVEEQTQMETNQRVCIPCDD